MSSITDTPPRAPPIKYDAPLGTRWARETAAAGGASAFDFPTDPKSIGPWILGECVGKGASGRVKIAKHKRTGQLAAVKILPIAPLIDSRNSLRIQHAMYEQLRLGIDREITMMKLMNHPNIMRIYDVFEAETELYLVLEYVEGGELYDFLVNRGRFPPQEALEYFKQIVYGLNYAHTFSIIHRDLKPENILIASLSPPLIKIADWGMAAFAPPSLQLQTSCGSPHYASPEIVNGEKYQGTATDIWSCGVTLYALLTGRLPFDDKDIQTLLAKVKSGIYHMPAWIDPLAKDLLSRMLVVEAAKRITIPEILVHPWLASARNFNRRANGKMLKQPSPPLPPSPSLLARPIASPDLVDPELFSSLRIIWGRHADQAGDSIKKDLCSPAGQGVYTKAFYYLLSKYREESYRKRLVDGEDADDTINGISRLTFDRSWAKGGAKMAYGIRRQWVVPVVPPSAYTRHRITSNPVQSPDPAADLRRFTPLHPPMERTTSRAASRERPPVGPWPIPYPLQPARGAPSVGPVRLVSSIAIPTRKIAAGPRPQLPRRGHPFSHQAENRTAFEERPVDYKTVARGPSGTSEDGRRNTVASAAPVTGRKDNLQQTRIPSLALHSPVSSPSECRKNQDGQAPFDVRSPRAPIRAQMNENPSLNVPASLGAATLAFTNTSNGTKTQASTKVYISTNKVGDAHTSANCRAMRHDVEPKDRGRRRAPQFDNRGAGDKENQGICNTGNPPGARRASGVGLGIGISGARDVCHEMGNVIYIGTGSTPMAKGKKERKSKPPALDIPARRPTLSALGSPMIISSPVASNNSGSPTRLLTSPVVGEFKGWFSSLFNWKNGASGSGQGNTIYSPDDFSKTLVDVSRLLETLGVILMFEKPSGSQSDDTARLKCRIEELSIDPQVNISLKPVRFRVEFTPIQQTKPLIRQSIWSPPLSPITDNTCFFLPPNDEDPIINGSKNQALLHSAPNPGLTPRVRMSMLPVVMRAPSSGQNTPMPSPGLTMSPGACPTGNANGSDVPYGALCSILLVYEKGSTSSFKTIWRKVKDVYCGSPTKIAALQSPQEFSAFSPIMASTPVSQACPTGQFASPCS